ncbi:MAG: rhomboid family intramembrane serine protease [Sandaracinaceae bacterium]|nr:rhomboid family intramembrane serine protease [Sandaracinaceae bacterium]
MVQPPPIRETLPAPRARPAGPTEAQIRFRAALQGAMRREWVTDLLVASNVLVLGWMVLSGVSPFLPDVESLVDWGANHRPLTRGGEWWRMVSSMFVHGGLVHLGFNMYALLIAGRLVERLYGHLGYALLYLLAGLAGSAASALTPPTSRASAPPAPSSASSARSWPSCSCAARSCRPGCCSRSADRCSR